jgi:hypothetical protein
MGRRKSPGHVWYEMEATKRWLNDRGLDLRENCYTHMQIYDRQNRRLIMDLWPTASKTRVLYPQIQQAQQQGAFDHAVRFLVGRYTDWLKHQQRKRQTQPATDRRVSTDTNVELIREGDSIRMFITGQLLRADLLLTDRAATNLLRDARRIAMEFAER